MAGSDLTKAETLKTLRVLSNMRVPLWLAGGIAADFHVGRWTRHHDDIDLVTFEEHRDDVETEFPRVGFTKTSDDGWIARWTRAGRDVGEVSMAFMRRDDETTGSLVITPEGSRGGRVVTGVYPGVEGNLDPKRTGTVEGVTFRVASPEDDWVFTHTFNVIHPGATPGPTDVHNLALLESVLSEIDRERLRPLIGRRIPLEDVDA